MATFSFLEVTKHGITAHWSFAGETDRIEITSTVNDLKAEFSSTPIDNSQSTIERFDRDELVVSFPTHKPTADS